MPNPPEKLTVETEATYRKAIESWTDDDRTQQAEARKRLVPPPRKLDSLFTFEKSELVDEEDAANSPVPQHLLAATRNPDGINAEVLLLHRTDRGWSVEPNGPTVLYRYGKDFLTPETLCTVFGASIRISQPGLVAALWKQENDEWKAMQEKYRILQRFYLIELTENIAVVGNTQLRLDVSLGLQLST